MTDISFQRDGYALSLAATDEDIRAVQRLRYSVFVQELGGSGPGVDHNTKLETDRFDSHADHLMLRHVASDQVVGVYRLMREDQAQRAGGFYSAAEFDVSPVLSSGRKVLELGRSCVAPDHRHGGAMFHLWSGLAHFVQAHDIEILFGVASLPGTDTQALAGPLSVLHHQHLAPPHLRAKSLKPANMDILAPGSLDRKAGLVAMPSLIKAYLRMGGQVGEGAFVDDAFGCTDVCMIMDTQKLNARHADRYVRASP